MLLVVCCLLISLIPFISVQGQESQRFFNDAQRLLSFDGDEFSFVVIGDRTGSGPDSWKVFSRALSETNRLRPEFVVMIGDVIEGGGGSSFQIEAKWNEAKSHLDSLKVPLFIIPGNHDIWDRASYDVWKQVIGETYSAFSYANCRFVFLNSEEIHGTGEAGFGTRQLNFIKNQIHRHKQSKQIFFFVHQPIWIFSGPLKSQWEEIESLLAGIQYSVIAGHLHVLGSTIRNGQRHLLVGPTGGEMRLPRNPALGLFHHITRFSVEGDTSHVTFIESEKTYPESLARNAYVRFQAGRMLLKGLSRPNKKIP